MLTQKTEWGHINWLHTQKVGNEKQSFSIGITNILPGKNLEEHVHYGIEQFLYILDGEGIYIINGVEKKFKKGMSFYIEADSSHKTINTGNISIREFLVSNPIRYDDDIQINDGLYDDSIDEYRLNMIYSAVEAIRSQLLNSISLPFTIYDDMWSVIIQSNHFSTYCIDMCDPLGNPKNCNCMLDRNFNNLDNGEGYQFICEYGLLVFHYPIIYNGKQLGSIRGGHILISDSTDKSSNVVYDYPRSTVIGIKSLLKQIISSITSYCAFNNSRLLLENKDKVLRDVLTSNTSLKKDLFVIKDKVTNLRINHHFLFNTLNSLASMALTDDRYNIYNSIIDLSKMFRYTMTVDLKFVSLSSEIEYLETYLNLQRLRYGNDLIVSYEIEDRLKNITVPFNFLQPVVENAFTHGFSPSDDKKVLKIIVHKLEEKAKISIINNGVPLNNLTLNRINRSLISNTGHGLSLIYEKLKSAYSKDFTMLVVSDGIEQTGVIMEIPMIIEEELHD